MTITNCTFIGKDAGVDIIEGNGLVIIGDNIRDLSKSQRNVLFLDSKTAIGDTIGGESCNLKQILSDYMGKT